MRDNSGREYAKISELMEDQVVDVDDGFACMSAGQKHVHIGDFGPYIECAEGYHWLSGQCDGGGHCIGVYPVPTE